MEDSIFSAKIVLHQRILPMHEVHVLYQKKKAKSWLNKFNCNKP